MKKLEKKLKKIVIVFFVIFLLIIFAGSFFNSCRYWNKKVTNNFVYPYIETATQIKNELTDSIHYNSMSKRELISEINRLSSANDMLASQAILLKDLEEQNTILREKHELPALAKFKYLNGEIIARDPLNWFEYFTINRGGYDGVQKGAAVFSFDKNSNAMLLGVVEFVYNHSSMVMSINNSNLKFSGKLGISKQIGMINYNRNKNNFNNLFVSLDLLPTTENYIIDEEVFTTGLEENIPAGIKIGNLSTINKANSIFSNDLYVSGTVSIQNNFNNTRFITVAIKKNL